MNSDTPTEPTDPNSEDDLARSLLLLPSSLPINVDASAPPAEKEGEIVDVERKRDLNELTGSSCPLPLEGPAKE